MREYKNGDETYNCLDLCLAAGGKYYLKRLGVPYGTNSFIEVSDIEPIGDPQYIPAEWGEEIERIYLLNDFSYYIGDDYTNPILARFPNATFATLQFPSSEEEYIFFTPYFRSYIATNAYSGDDATHFTNQVGVDEYPAEIRRYYYDEDAPYRYVDLGEGSTAIYFNSWKQVEPTPAEDPNLSLVVTSEEIYENNTLPLAEKATLVLGDSDHHLYRHDSDKKRGYIPIDDETPNLPLIYDDTNDTLSAVDVLNIKKLSAEELISQDFKSDVFLITDKSNYDTNKNKLGLADGAVLILREEA